MDVDSNMAVSDDSDHDQATSNGPKLEQNDSSQQQTPQPPQPPQQGSSGVVGPRCAPLYSVVKAIIDKPEDGPGPRYGHTLTAVPAVGEEGSQGYIGPRLILFGGATSLEGNSAASGTPTSAGSAGIIWILLSHLVAHALRQESVVGTPQAFPAPQWQQHENVQNENKDLCNCQKSTLDY